MSILQARVQAVAAKALQVAGGHVAEMMRQLVDVECTADSVRGTTKDRRHSAPGEPPRRESGDGQASIIMEPTATGARVGPKNIGIAVLAGNYMAMWDSEKARLGKGRRPWLSTWRRYKPEMDSLVDGYIRKGLA